VRIHVVLKAHRRLFLMIEVPLFLMSEVPHGAVEDSRVEGRRGPVVVVPSRLHLCAAVLDAACSGASQPRFFFSTKSF